MKQVNTKTVILVVSTLMLFAAVPSIAQKNDLKLKSFTAKVNPNPLTVSVSLKRAQILSEQGISAQVTLLNHSDKSIDLIDEPLKCFLRIKKDGLTVNVREGISFLRINGPSTNNVALLPKLSIEPNQTRYLTVNVSQILSNPSEYYDKRQKDIATPKKLIKLPEGSYSAMVHCSLYWYGDNANFVQLNTQFTQVNYFASRAN